MPESMDLEGLRPIDFVEVLDRIGGDTSFLKELLEMYFLEYAEKRRLLDEAIIRQDFVQVCELGHSLKGASANLSLARLRRVAGRLETAGKEKELVSAQEAARTFETEVESLKSFLAQNHPEELP
jgi:two-component system, sensor histidine kinase and response regulator